MEKTYPKAKAEKMATNEIGDSKNSLNLQYFSINKFLKNNNNNNDSSIKFNKLIFYYERNSHLISMKFVFYDELNKKEVFTEPQILGPINLKLSQNIIDEVTLELDSDEVIYAIRGFFHKDKIRRLLIQTTSGKYMEFGKDVKKFNFQWDYHYNQKTFDGFIIGWNNNNINYLANIYLSNEEIKKENLALQEERDETIKFIFDPLYLSSQIGFLNPNARAEDHLKCLSILNEVKKRQYFISEITCYYSNYLNYFEVEYTSKLGGKKLRYVNLGKETNKGKDKKQTITIEPGDWINYIKIGYEESLCLLNLRTYQGKAFNCVENSYDLSLNILGFVVGYDERIDYLQIYYDKKIL